MTKPVVVGLLGITHPHASARVRALREIEGVEVLSAADTDPRLSYFTDKYDLTAASIEDVLGDDRISAIMVHSKSVDMVPHALRSLAAGKAVLVEKPGGGTLADLEELARAESNSGQVVQVGYNVQLSESVSSAKELLAAGIIGEVVTASARGAALVGEHLTAHLNQPADMGGALWVIGCHVLDAVVSLFGAPETVNARVHKSPRLSDERSREDSAAALLNYPDMSLAFNFDTHDLLEWFESSRITIHGTKGMLEVGILPQRLRVFVDQARGGYRQGWTEWTESHFTKPFARTEENKFSELPELENLSNFRTEMRGFVEAVRGNSAPVSPVSEALAVARIINACYQSERDNGACVDVSAAS